MHAVDRATGKDEIFARWFFWEIMRRRDAKIKTPQGQARVHEHDALGLVFSREANQGKVRGVSRSDDEIGLRQIRALHQRATNTTNDAPLPCDQNAVDLTRRKPLYRLGEAKRLVFMAGLAVTDQPKCE